MIPNLYGSEIGVSQGCPCCSKPNSSFLTPPLPLSPWKCHQLAPEKFKIYQFKKNENRLKPLDNQQNFSDFIEFKFFPSCDLDEFSKNVFKIGVDGMDTMKYVLQRVEKLLRVPEEKFVVYCSKGFEIRGGEFPYQQKFHLSPNFMYISLNYKKYVHQLNSLFREKERKKQEKNIEDLKIRSYRSGQAKNEVMELLKIKHKKKKEIICKLKKQCEIEKDLVENKFEEKELLGKSSEEILKFFEKKKESANVMHRHLNFIDSKKIYLKIFNYLTSKSSKLSETDSKSLFKKIKKNISVSYLKLEDYSSLLFFILKNWSDEEVKLNLTILYYKAFAQTKLFYLKEAEENFSYIISNSKKSNVIETCKKNLNLIAKKRRYYLYNGLSLEMVDFNEIYDKYDKTRLMMEKICCEKLYQRYTNRIRRSVKLLLLGINNSKFKKKSGIEELEKEKSNILNELKTTRRWGRKSNEEEQKIKSLRDRLKEINDELTSDFTRQICQSVLPFQHNGIWEDDFDSYIRFGLTTRIYSIVNPGNYVDLLSSYYEKAKYYTIESRGSLFLKCGSIFDELDHYDLDELNKGVESEKFSKFVPLKLQIVKSKLYGSSDEEIENYIQTIKKRFEKELGLKSIIHKLKGIKKDYYSISNSPVFKQEKKKRLQTLFYYENDERIDKFHREVMKLYKFEKLKAFLFGDLKISLDDFFEFLYISGGFYVCGCGSSNIRSFFKRNLPRRERIRRIDVGIQTGLELEKEKEKEEKGEEFEEEGEDSEVEEEEYEEEYHKDGYDSDTSNYSNPPQQGTQDQDLSEKDERKIDEKNFDLGFFYGKEIPDKKQSQGGGTGGRQGCSIQ